MEVNVEIHLKARDTANLTEIDRFIDPCSEYNLTVADILNQLSVMDKSLPVIGSATGFFGHIKSALVVKNHNKISRYYKPIVLLELDFDENSPTRLSVGDLIKELENIESSLVVFSEMQEPPNGRIESVDFGVSVENSNCDMFTDDDEGMIDGLGTVSAINGKLALIS